MATNASHPLVAAARAAGVRDLRVLHALAAVPRARYVRPSDAGDADRGIPIAIGGEPVTTQPSLLAVMERRRELAAAAAANLASVIRERVIARASFVALYGRHGFAPRTGETPADGH